MRHSACLHFNPAATLKRLADRLKYASTAHRVTIVQDGFLWKSPRGRAGTQWWISPKKNAAGLIMVQRENAFAQPFAVEFKRLAYQAVQRKS